MDSMRLVAGPEHRLDQAFLEGGRRWWGGRGSVAGEDREPADDGGHQVGIGTWGRPGPDLLVVEEGDQTDSGLLVEGVGGGEGFDDALGGTVRHHLVVEPARVDKLVREAAEAGRVGVVEDHLKVDDIVRADAGFSSNALDNRGVMALGDGTQGLEAVAVAIAAGLRLARLVLVELGGGKTGNREQLGLFVELKPLLPFQVDGKRGDSKDGAFDSDELGDDVAVLAADHGSPSDRQVSIKPGMPKPAFNPPSAHPSLL